MIGSILRTIGYLLNATSNRLEIEHLRDAVRQLEAHKEHTQTILGELTRTLQDHERRLLYLEFWKENQDSCRDKMQDLKRRTDAIEKCGARDGLKSPQPRQSKDLGNKARPRYHPPKPRTRERPDVLSAIASLTRSRAMHLAGQSRARTERTGGTL